ncbi:unnamed protein product [Durusdinium trenchii]|uniref:Uncharacterized protein n=2 Tax=Durusdinium trenchii TaxID=1381693 RepID=A0ABP0LP07_9DINO
MPDLKRRRLMGKQPAPEGQNNRDARNVLTTWLRDRWVASRMSREGLTGHAVRNTLRLAFNALAPEDKAAWLRLRLEADFPVHFRAAASALLSLWQSERPIVEETRVPACYRGNGTMFRYSGSFSKIVDAETSALLAAGQAETIPDVCAKLRGHPQLCALWDEFTAFFERLQASFHLDRWTLALELHCKVSVQTQVPSIHFHAMFDSRKPVILPKSALDFRGAGPHISVDAPHARGRACKRAYDQGHFYLQVPKIGGIFMRTNSPAYDAFAVTPEWITSLWQTCKITKDTAEKEYIRAKKHVRAYVDNVHYHSQCERAQAVAEKKAQALGELQLLKKEAVRIDAVDADFLPQFNSLAFRRKFLVLDGPTRLGKTIYASSLAGEANTLEVNCANVSEPDLRAFDPLRHKAIVFDEGSPAMVIAHKKLFQGGVEEVSMSHSSTNMYSYKVWVYNCMLILTSNKWREEAAAMDQADQSWLAQNSVLVICERPLYRQ